MNVSTVKIHLCFVCNNRQFCLPEYELFKLDLPVEKFNHRLFLYFKKDDFIFEEDNDAEGVFNIYHGKVCIFNDKNKKVIRVY